MSFQTNSVLHDDMLKHRNNKRPSSRITAGVGSRESWVLPDARFKRYRRLWWPRPGLTRLSARQHHGGENDVDKEMPAVWGQVLSRQKTQQGLVPNHLDPRQSLIAGVSHHYNNLFMALWGNASLIRMYAAYDPAVCDWAGHIEQRLQARGYLIHLLLGYAGERRISARRVRFRHLLCEISEQKEKGLLEKGLAEVSDCRNMPLQNDLIASGAADLAGTLLPDIEAMCNHIAERTRNHPRIQKRTAVFAALIGKAKDLTFKLQRYAGQTAIHFKSTSLNRMVQRQCQAVRNKHPECVVIGTLTPGLPLIRTDGDQLDWVLGQVMENGCQAMPDGGCLTVRVGPLHAESPRERCGLRAARGYVVITVTDTGIGMSKCVQARIFDPFFTHGHDRSSTGLGLAAARGIVKALGGYIQVQSRADSGSTFKIYVPADGIRPHA